MASFPSCFQCPLFHFYIAFNHGISPLLKYVERYFHYISFLYKEQKDLAFYIKTYSSMKPKEAAAIFDTMTDNLKLVAQILDGMDADSRAAILGKMTSDTAAKVTEIMKPSE